jgi:hypothetical protein
VFTDGAFEDWSYIFFHTCLKRSFSKFSLYTRANLLISAARIARDLEPRFFRPPMTDSIWEENEGASFRAQESLDDDDPGNACVGHHGGDWGDEAGIGREQ